MQEKHARIVARHFKAEGVPGSRVLSRERIVHTALCRQADGFAAGGIGAQGDDIATGEQAIPRPLSTKSRQRHFKLGQHLFHAE